MVIKIALVGKPSMGKTTIKKVIFEGIDANDLILFPLEATIGSKFSVHDFMDLKISLVDTPGQSITILLEDEDKHMNIFDNTSAIIYIFDYKIWIAHSNEVISDIKKIYDINEKYNYGAKIYLYLHKIDLIDENIINKFKLLKTQIINQLNLPKELKIFFTSLHPNLVYTIFNAVSETLYDFSLDVLKLKDILIKILKDLSKTICFITNQKNNIITQTMTIDFDENSVFNLYKKIIEISQSNDKLVSEKNNLSLVESCSKFFYVILRNIKTIHPTFKNIFIFSEILDKKELINLLKKLEIELDTHFNPTANK